MGRRAAVHPADAGARRGDARWRRPRGGDRRIAAGKRRVTNELAAANAVMAGSSPARSSRPRRASRARRARVQPARDPDDHQPCDRPRRRQWPRAPRARLRERRRLFGSGRTNLTVGRAVRFAARECRRGQGRAWRPREPRLPRQVCFCFGEAEESSPWAAAERPRGDPRRDERRDRRLRERDNERPRARRGDDVSLSVAPSSRGPATTTDVRGHPWSCSRLSSSSSSSKRAWRKRTSQRVLWERATVRAGEMSEPNREMMAAVRTEHYGEIEDDTELHVTVRRTTFSSSLRAGRERTPFTSRPSASRTLSRS